MNRMRKTTRALFAGLVAIGMLALEAPGTQAAGFLKFDGVDGEATDKNHDKWIDVISVNWGATRSTTTRSGQRLKQPRMAAGTVTITKRVDKASPALMRRNSSGKHMKKVIVDSNYGGARATYLKYELQNVRITSYTTTGSGANMTETISLSYQKIRAIPAPTRLKPKPKRK